MLFLHNVTTASVNFLLDFRDWDTYFYRMTALKKCLDFLNENVLTSSVYTCELKIKEIEEICLKRLSKTELGTLNSFTLFNIMI